MKRSGRLYQKTVILLLCMGILTGCGQRKEGDASLLTKDLEKKETVSSAQETESGALETEIYTETKTEEESAHTKEMSEPSKPAALILDEEELEIGEQEISYGQLKISFPTEISVEVKESEAEGTTVDLIGAQEWYEYNFSPLPPRLRFLHYKAEYEKEAGKMTLISALLDLFPDAGIRTGYLNEEEREYCFLIEDGRANHYTMLYYVLVRGDDLYLVEEWRVESDYSFRHLFEDEQTVQWKDSGKTIQSSGEYGFYRAGLVYMKVTAEEDFTFLCVYDQNDQDNRTLTLWQDGYFDTPYQYVSDLEAVIDREDFRDLNFDGFPDLDAGKRFYLWNHEKKEFEVSENSEEEYGFPWTYYMELFPETQTIWSYDISLVEGSFELAEKMEFLWQWEGNKLVKRRECKFTESDEGVRIIATDYDTDTILFDEFISAEEWEESAWKVQALYERFYDGYVPEETYGLRHSYWSGKEYIPGELVEKIAASMQNGTESECLEAMMNDRELTNEERTSLAETNPDLRLEIISAQSLLMVEADVDHDGINDIFAQSYYGGSGGFVDFILFKGKEDGSFEGSDRFGSVMQEFGIISFEGKNYLCRTDFDYGKKQYNGFSVSCYEDGKIVETVIIRLSADSYNIKVTECDERYTDLAQDSMSKALSYKNDIDAYENVPGSAEEGTEEDPEMTWKFRCDLDNDGKKEVYGKRIWTTSNMGTVDGLSMQGEDEDDEGMKQAEEAVFSGEGNPIMMWVDAWKGKNIVTVMYRTGLEDFEIIGYYVKEDGYEQVYGIEAVAVYGVKTERESPYTEEYYGPEFMG